MNMSVSLLLTVHWKRWKSKAYAKCLERNEYCCCRMDCSAFPRLQALWGSIHAVLWLKKNTPSRWIHSQEQDMLEHLGRDYSGIFTDLSINNVKSCSMAQLKWKGSWKPFYISLLDSLLWSNAVFSPTVYQTVKLLRERRGSGRPVN